MTKFKNRKGLALGSIIALLAATFVGVMPAKAATGDIVIEPAWGPATNFTALAGGASQSGMVLNTYYKTSADGKTSGSLSYKVEVLTDGLDLSDIDFDLSGMISTTLKPLPKTGATISGYVTGSMTVSQLAWGGVADPDLGVWQKATDSQSVVNYNLMHVRAHRTDGSTASFQVQVTAWNDSLDNNYINNGEDLVSEPVTLTFVYPYAVDFSITPASIVIGSATASVTVTPGSLNPGNFWNTQVGVTPVVAAGLAATNKITTPKAPTTALGYSTTLETLYADWDVSAGGGFNLSSGIVADEYFYALHLDGDNTATVVPSGTYANNLSTLTVSQEVGAATIVTYSPTVVGGSTVAQDTALVGGKGNVSVIEGTKTISFKFGGYTNTLSTVAIGAGVVGNVTITDATVDGAGSLGDTTLTTPAGTTLASTGVNSRTFPITSDINGEFAFDLTADEGNDGEYFTMVMTIEGSTSETITVAWEDEEISLFQGPSPTSMKIANGGSISVDYFVRNQWGQVPTGDYQLEVTRARSSGTRTTALGTSADWSYDVPVESDGTATVTITDNGSATVEGADTVTVQLQKKATAGGAFVDVATDGTEARSFTLTYETDLKTALLETTVNNNGAKRGTTTVKALALETETLRNFDSRVDVLDALEFAANNGYTSTTATTATDLVAITGYVKTAAGVGITGVPVVISGSGLMFSDGASGTATTVRHSLNSMILTTGTGGAYTFYVRGNLSGTKTVTVAAAGATNNVSLTFAAGSTAAANMAITAPATSDAGKVIDVVVKITDAYGNPASGVDVTFKSKGSGYLNALSGTSDADGEVIVKLITLTNDSGTATITATATLAGVSTAKVATVTVGAAAASADQKVNAGSFKGYVALYAKGYEGQRMSAKVGKDWVVVESLASNFERVVEFTGAGYTISVPIYIDRVLVDTIVVTTK